MITHPSGGPAIDFATFTWQRPISEKNGYQWAGDTLIEAEPFKLEDYQPPSGLHLEFADLRTRDDFLRFANRYGSLTNRRIPESLDNWKMLADEMWQMVTILNNLKSRKPNDSRANPAVEQLYLWAKELVISRLKPTAFWVGQRIGLRMAHEDLRDFMRFQLVNQALGSLEFKPCEGGCGRYLHLKPSDIKTCSPSCRNRLHLNRKRQAKEMHAKGKTARQIAKELNADINYVKKWIATLKEQAP